MFFKIGNQKYKDDRLRSCSVSTGGGMLGGHWGVDLRRDKDGNAILTVRERETHADREVTTVYHVDSAAFDHIAELVNEYDLYAASKRPMSDMQALDADTTSLSFTYSKGWFDIGEEQELTKKMREGFRKVIDYLHSLASGEGERSLEPQTAMLYLKSGYTLCFIVEDAFDGRLDGILSTERPVSPFEDCGIVLAEGETPELTGAQAMTAAAAGNIVFDTGTGSIILLHKDRDFGRPVYVLAKLNGYVSSACPLIEEMTGEYRLVLN